MHKLLKNYEINNKLKKINTGVIRYGRRIVLGEGNVTDNIIY